MSRGASAFGGAASGAGAGAAIGSFGGPIGTGIGAGVGAIGGALAGLFSGVDDAAEERARNLKRIMADIRMKQALMPQMGQNMLNRQLTARAPGNLLTGQIAGQQYMFKPEDYQQSPIPEGMFAPPEAKKPMRFR